MISAAMEFLNGDYQAHPLRWCAEVLGMGISVAVALVMASTTPYPPMLLCYVFWMVASTLLLGSAFSRQSTGFTLLYGSFLVIDGVGLIRTIWP